jgi:uncharacterized protein (TIGR02118 family)
MIKRVTVVHARPGRDRAEVLRYWREVHGALVAKVPGVKRYVQNHSIEGVRADSEPPFLGVGEVWFESRAEADRAQVTIEWIAVMTDAASFMAMDRVATSWAEEHQIV